jgi:tetratricopeptide (TPR) repeat protein
MAVAQRMRQQIPEALATLEVLEVYHPRYPRLFQERGHCQVFRREAPAAIAAFERAVQLNPALPASWKALQNLYRMVQRPADVDRCGQHLATLAALPPEVVTARSMFMDGEIEEAEALIRRFLMQHGEHVEGMRVLANIATENEYPLDAEVLLEAVLRLVPAYHAARYDYILALVDLHKHGKAREQSEQLIAADPASPAPRVTLASVLLALGELDESVARFRALVEEFPRDAEIAQSLGHALKTLGKQEDAVAAYRRAAEVRPGFGEPFWSLANLKTYRFTDDEIARMRDLESAPGVQPVDQQHLCFALGKSLEDRGEYADSFTHYERGNAIKKSQSRYRAPMHERSAKRLREVCSAEFFNERKGWGCDSPAPIFVVGMPRAGSTLLEQILASHSQVEGTTELANVPRLVSNLSGRDRMGEPPYPRVLQELPEEQFRRFGEEYLRDTLDYRTGKPRFIDKMPNNFRNIGLIHLMLPNARIIDARRDAMDCCFSNFKQLYARGHQFAYSQEDIGRYYSSYVEMMEHWDAVLPGRVFRVNHDDVLADLEGSVRRILDYCGLPFEQACLEFHKTERRVHTASSEQVRRPINRDGVDQWKPYSEWLGPLREALGPLARS